MADPKRDMKIIRLVLLKGSNPLDPMTAQEQEALAALDRLAAAFTRLWRERNEAMKNQA